MTPRAAGSAIAIRTTGSRYLSGRRTRPYATALPPPVLDAYAPADVAFAAKAWTMRAEEERRSAAVFAALVSALIDCGEPLDVASVFARIVDEELAHSELCATLAARFTAKAPAAAVIERPSPREPSERRLGALRTLLVEGAIGETLSSALFALGRRLAKEPCTRAALSRILRDEVTHARASWEALTVMRPSLSDHELEELQRTLASAFAFLEQGMVPTLKRLERGEPFTEAWAELGVLPPERRVETFYGAIEGRVTVGLEKLGLDAKRAWRERYAPG